MELNEMKRNEMKICSVKIKICTLQKCMEICSLRNKNLYFAKRKSVVCEMIICTLRNGNLYFAKRKSVTLFDVPAASEQKIVSYKKTPCIFRV